METTDAPRRSSNGIALAVAIAALTLSLLPYIFRGRVECSFIRFLDSDSGEPIGFMKAEYGALTIAQFNKKDDSRIELKLRGDGLVVELLKRDSLVGKWSLTRDTDTLTRIGGAAKP